MTPMASLLKQRSVLCRRALETTGDVNEAYMIVHQVMVGAVRAVRDHAHDLGPALTRALDMRSRRLAGARAAI